MQTERPINQAQSSQAQGGQVQGSQAQSNQAQSSQAQGGQVQGSQQAQSNQAQSICGVGDGTLPGPCAPLAFPYIPMQEKNPTRYGRAEALQTGTLFPGLNLPFRAEMTGRMRTDNTALAELMALDFAIDELGLYLTTHPKDQEVLDLYWSYIKLANEGREKYERLYGPLLQTDITPEGYTWLNDPWPWEKGGSD